MTSDGTRSEDVLRDLVWAEITTAGYSQARVCETVGVTPKHLSGYVTGRCGMSLDLVDRVLAAVGRELVLGSRVRPLDEEAGDG